MKWKTGIIYFIFIAFFAFPAWSNEPRDISEIDEIVTVDFMNADIKMVLKFFKDMAKKDIVFDECVQGKVTIKLEQVPIYDAFRTILNYVGLDYEQEGNVIRIYCKADSKIANSDPDESTALPGIRAKVFASIKEKGEDESKTLPRGMEMEFSDGLGLWMIAPALPATVSPIELKSFNNDGNLNLKTQLPLAIMKKPAPLVILFTLQSSPPDGVEVKASFSYSYAEELDTDTDDKAYRTISGTRQKLITSSNVDEPILLLAAPDGNEYYLYVIPEELSQ